MSPVAIAGTYCFCPVCFFFFFCWTTLTVVITFEPFQKEPSYLACRFLFNKGIPLIQKKMTYELDLQL